VHPEIVFCEEIHPRWLGTSSTSACALVTPGNVAVACRRGGIIQDTGVILRPRFDTESVTSASVPCAD
jgi:hypothetical protein